MCNSTLNDNYRHVLVLSDKMPPIMRQFAFNLSCDNHLYPSREVNLDNEVLFRSIPNIYTNNILPYSETEGKEDSTIIKKIKKIKLMLNSIFS